MNAFCAERFKEMKDVFERSGATKETATPSGRGETSRESLDSAIKRAIDFSQAANEYKNVRQTPENQIVK
jgi:hypothetical protein